jgi:peptidoglycan/LPS O-acetylase OafA/YrhL
MRTASRKLDQLTSLRFFAALMIVVHHSAGLFGTPGESPVNYGQGVSFFFVLSGFILTYVYPQLAGGAGIRRFWRARVARIWPAHLATLLLCVAMGAYSWWGASTLVANLTMTQSWLGMSKYYFSFNAVSWSISTEFFFYLVFPLLILRWDRTWWWKLLLVLGVLLALFAYSNAAGLPAYGDPNPGDGQGAWVTQHGLIYIHPLARLFEFTVGMCVALAWRRAKDRDLGAGAGTALELGALALCAVSMAYMNYIAFRGGQTLLGDAGRMWLMHAGSMFAFGVLIFVCALGRGWVSRALALPGIVLLGEISYSMYLVHQLLLRYYKTHLVEFAGLPGPVAGVLFMAVLLLVSYLMWSLVEMPGRRLLVGGGGTVHGSAVLARSWTDKLALHRRALAAAVAMVVLVVVAHVVGSRQVAPTTAAVPPLAANPAPPPAAMPGYAGTHFGADATLQALALTCAADALELRTEWASGNGTAGALRNAVHVVDEAGGIVTQFDYPQPAPTPDVRNGGTWVDQVRMPYARLRDTGAWRVALGVYDQAGGLRKVDRGVRDWGDRRLVIPLPDCARAALRSATPSDASAQAPTGS